MRITRRQLKRLIYEAVLVEDAVGSTVPLEVLKSVELKFKQILHELPNDFGAMPLVISAAKAIINARRAAEQKQ